MLGQTITFALLNAGNVCREEPGKLGVIHVRDASADNGGWWRHHD